MASAARQPDMSPAEWEARQQLAACYRIFDHFGWSELIYNHITLRVPDEENAFLINPFGLLYSEVTASNLVKIDILLNKEPIDALSFIAHREEARDRAVQMCSLLKKLIPRQNFQVDIQGAIGSKIISRATIKPYRKDVTWKIHPGDPDRRAKLLEKQKRGKKRMKSVGRVEVPQDAFMAVLRMNDDDINGK